MSRAPIRRSQLIAPFGVGGMIVSPDGASLIGGGLDFWYRLEIGSEIDDPDEFRVQEWRLENLLEVDYFRLPPDFRRPRPHQATPNSNITIPFLRFPRWHVCPKCSKLDERGLTERGRILCKHCLAESQKRTLHQVPFIAVCDAGHIQDFPFREWVHQSINPHCDGTLSLFATGGASLGGQTVKCSCEASRSLANITVVEESGEWTHLTEKLEDGARYPCPGLAPWLGATEPTICGRPLRGSLRSAANVYFPQQASAIYLPRKGAGASSDLIELLENDPTLSMFIRVMADAGNQAKPEQLRQIKSLALRPFSNDEIRDAVEILTKGKPEAVPIVEDEDLNTAFRRPEFEALRRARKEQQLLIRPADLATYEPTLTQYFSRINLVDRLKETRAFTGFTRVFPENSQSLDDRKGMLWRSPDPNGETWLPAYVVYGEGIFLEIDETELKRWEVRTNVSKRVQRLIDRYRAVSAERHLRERPLSPRLVLVHTLAHLLMLRLTFECGYGTSALRERLYVSTDSNHPMAGVLIYTAAGDSEGTMGGLVRMGRPGNLEPVVRRALEGALWCSADPICMEIAISGGQGPNSLNLAACHGCCLVPETSCELFNSFLDRGLLVGDQGNADLGFFSALLAEGTPPSAV
jgi:Domain of unknown function (DUF1998)